MALPKAAAPDLQMWTPPQNKKKRHPPSHRCPFRGNRWVSLVDEEKPPGKPGIATYFPTKTTKKDTYGKLVAFHLRSSPHGKMRTYVQYSDKFPLEPTRERNLLLSNWEATVGPKAHLGRLFAVVASKTSRAGHMNTKKENLRKLAEGAWLTCSSQKSLPNQCPRISSPAQAAFQLAGGRPIRRHSRGKFFLEAFAPYVKSILEG